MLEGYGDIENFVELVTNCGTVRVRRDPQHGVADYDVLQRSCVAARPHQHISVALLHRLDSRGVIQTAPHMFPSTGVVHQARFIIGLLEELIRLLLIG